MSVTTINVVCRDEYIPFSAFYKYHKTSMDEYSGALTRYDPLSVEHASLKVILRL